MARSTRSGRSSAAILLAAVSLMPPIPREAGAIQLTEPATSGVAKNPSASFAASVVPAMSVPVRIGARFGLHVSSGTAGYASLYVIDPVYSVRVLAENLPLPAGSLRYPTGGLALQAEPPVGFNWVILLVTRQPFSGFSGNDTLTTPVSTALGGRDFIRELNRATDALPANSWTVDEVRIRVVG